MSEIKVSILTITYNHEKYIARAIESFLMQKTDFPFEIIIADDASTDKNQEIIKAFRDKYPKVIKPILRKENLEPNDNWLDAVCHCKGKYIALCEGDDYWTDPYKLQKQVDFLEANPGYGLIYSDISMIDKNNNPIETTTFYETFKMRYRLGDVFFYLLDGNFINSLTVCFRKDLIDFDTIDLKEKCYIYDYWLWLRLAMLSKIHFMNEKTAAYRIHDQGISRQKYFFKKRTPLVLLNILQEYFNEEKQELSLREKEILFNKIYLLLRNSQINIQSKFWLTKLLFHYFPSFKYVTRRAKKKFKLGGT